MTTATVRLHDLRRVYDDGPRRVVALDAVTVDFHAATFTAIMGPSGSGKSTLLHCAAGLDRPTGGTVHIDGTELGGLNETALTRLRRDRIGFVFQAFNLVTSLTAAQNVTLPVRLAGRRTDPAALATALDAVGLADRAAHRPGTLSGGEQQRVAIARAVFSQPSVIFADEPTGALDSRTSRQVLELLRGLVDRHGRTLIMVTHDPLAAASADEVLLLADGRLVDRITDATADTIATRMAALDVSC